MLEALDVRSVEPVAGRPYEWVRAEATYAVDPDAGPNTSITDLGLAARSADGLVRYRGDVGLLRPKDGNRRVLLSVCNRGSVSLPFSSGMGMQGLKQAPAIEDDFLLEQGWTIAWGGWQWDVDRGSGAAGLDAPVLEVEPGMMRSEFFLYSQTDELPLADQTPVAAFSPYPTADVNDVGATLTVRSSQMGERHVVPRDQWRFTSTVSFSVDGGFQPFRWYELFYRSAYAPVAGTGLLAVRDLGAYLRKTHEHVFACGVSQTGRFLRQLVSQGLNVDERGDQVFDGLFVHIASARRGEFNRRYSQPSLVQPLMPEYGRPYGTADLLARQRQAGGVPKIMFTNSAAEYWRGDAALVHQDPDTGDDLPEDPDARVHLISGTDHLGPIGVFKRYMPVANPTHNLDPNPVLRALFTQLVAWVCEGTEPSPSQVPRRADGTAASRADVLARFTDCAVPDPRYLPYTPEIDPESATWPIAAGAPRAALVSAVDPRGNETAGIRLPEVSLGMAAFTGWNARKHIDGLPDVLYDMVGSRLPARNGSRPAERDVRQAAAALVRDRFLLERDVEGMVARAMSELE